MATITGAKSPRYVSESPEYIYLDVQFKEFGDEWIPFVAHKDDCTVYGRALWKMAADGQFGSIEEYTEVLPDLAVDVRAERDALLRELDNVAQNPLRYKELQEDEVVQLSEYRQLLLDVPQQSTFPDSVVFPEKPECLVVALEGANKE